MPGKKLSDKDLEHFRAQLALMLGVLDGDISRLQAEALGEAGRGDIQGDDGGIYALEFSFDLLERDSSAKSEVQDALDRLAEGTYGRCERCDAWIRKERLSAMPHARHCIVCQRAVEAEQA